MRGAQMMTWGWEAEAGRCSSRLEGLAVKEASWDKEVLALCRMASEEEAMAVEVCMVVVVEEGRSNSST